MLGISLTMESLILAQGERWREASYMQVVRPARGVANGCVTRKQPALVRRTYTRNCGQTFIARQEGILPPVKVMDEEGLA
jgi:hypothetical protein